MLLNLILSVDEPFLINIDNEVLKNSNKNLLGINLNNRLDLDTHVANICNRMLACFSENFTIHEHS